MSCQNTVKKQFSELRTELVNCGYPEHLILQVPAPYKDKNNTLSFNFDNKSLVTNIIKNINRSNSAYLKEVSKD